MSEQKIHFTLSAQCDAAVWDRELLSLADCHPFQSGAFAACMKQKGMQPWFLRLATAEGHQGNCLLFLSRQRIAHWFYGPVLTPTSTLTPGEAFKSTVDYLKHSSLRPFGIRSAGAAIAYSDSAELPVPFPKAALGKTPIIDLRQSQELGLRAFAPAARNKVRKCEAAGVTVEFSSSPEAVALYLDMLQRYRRHIGLPMPPFYPDQESIGLFSGPHSQMEIALGKVGDKYLSGLGFVRFGGIVTEIAVAQSGDYGSSKLAVQDLIKVRAVERYSAMGLKYYDLAGVTTDSTDEKEKSIAAFKMKFTSQVRYYPRIHNLPFRTVRYWLGRVANRLEQRV